MSRILVAVFLFAAIAGIAVSPAFAASPAIAVTPLSDHPSAKVTVSGSGFGASEAIDIYFDTTDEVLAFTDSAGKFTKHSFKVAADVAPGEHWVTAVGRHDGAAAQKLFTVATTWAEFGFKSNGKRNNPFENVLTTNDVKNLDTAWVAATGDIIQSSAAVANGVVYIGSGDFKLHAFDAFTGATLWAAATSSWVASSPAIANGTVYVGSDDGYLYAFNASTGAKIWSTFLGSHVDYNSPSFANGIVYIGGEYGTFFALDAATGATLWSAPVGTYPSTAAITNGIVYVTDEGSGNGSFLYAFNATTGATLWSVPVQEFQPSSPAVANGIVYIASGDGLLALDAVTGATVWNAHIGGFARSSPAIANGVVYLGWGDGNLHAFNASTGLELWHTPVDGYIWYSSPAVANGVIYAGTFDSDKISAFDAATGTKLWSAVVGGGYAPTTSPAVADGWLYVGSYDQHLYAYALDGGNNAVYKHRHTTPPSFATLHPDHRLKPTI